MSTSNVLKSGVLAVAALATAACGNDERINGAGPPPDAPPLEIELEPGEDGAFGDPLLRNEGDSGDAPTLVANTFEDPNDPSKKLEVPDEATTTAYPDKTADDPNQDEPDIAGQDKKTPKKWLVTEKKMPKSIGTRFRERADRVDFRAATWNLYKMTRKKANSAFPFSNRNVNAGGKVRTMKATNKAQTAFEILKTYEVDIAGLQEVNLWERKIFDQATPQQKAARPPNTKTQIAALKGREFTETVAQHPILSPPIGQASGYKVIVGQPIFVKRYNPKVHKTHTDLQIAWTYWEYAPIAYNPDVLSCSAASSRVVSIGIKAVHRVACTVIGTSKSFIFVNTHLPAKAEATFSAIDNLGKLTNAEFAGTQLLPPPPKVAPAEANAIVAMDMNSHPDGHTKKLRDKWAEFSAYKELKRPRGKFSKVHHRKLDQGGWGVFINKDRKSRYIDDLVPIGEPIKWCINKSRQILPVTVFPMGGWSQRKWREFYSLSDHLPVIADFDVSRNGSGC